jgi:hypothetical protein
MTKISELKLHIGRGDLIPPPSPKRLTKESIARMLKIIEEAEKLREEEQLNSR